MAYATVGGVLATVLGYHSPTMSLAVGLGTELSDQLLSLLALHTRRLSDTNEDARLVARGYERPSYVVDFELLFSYAFSAQIAPSAASGVAYLFHQRGSRLMLGPGTAIELLRAINRAFEESVSGRTLARLSALDARTWTQAPEMVDDLMSRLRQGRGRYKRRPDDPDSFGLFLLSSLFSESGFQFLDFEAIVDSVDAVKDYAASLDNLRPRRPENNFADALNIVAVLQRRTAEKHALEQPYLLTNSQPLFNERFIGFVGESAHPLEALSRDVATALYSFLAFDHAEDAFDLADRTLEQTIRVAHLRADLVRLDLEQRRLSPSSSLRRGSVDDLARAVASNSLDDRSRETLLELGDLLADPIILRAQEILDDIEVVEANIAKQRGEFEGVVASDARTIEFLIGLASIARRGSDSVAGAWRAAFEMQDQAFGAYSRRTLFQREGRTTDNGVLVLEHHVDVSGESHYLLNWPGGRDAALLVNAFSQACVRHHITVARITFGLEESAAIYEVELPLTTTDLGQVAKDHGIVWWLRFDTDDFVLFGDLVSDSAGAGSGALMVGLSGSRLDPTHVVDLHQKTSTHYILDDWLEEILSEFISTSGISPPRL
jgi:hypothetical protein